MEYWTRGVTVYDLDKCLEAIRIRNEDNEAKIKRLQQENERLICEHYKDDELAQMKSDLEKMKQNLSRGFPISEKEDKKIDDWFTSHNNGKCKNKRATTLTYYFTPTELGTLGTVHCSCGEKLEFRGI